ncbi:MAG: adenylate/guanylate cyclase domain-containing protein [Dongiaceae bacterium]
MAEMAIITAERSEAASPAAPRPPADPIARWLVDQAPDLPSTRFVIGEFCRRLVADGMSLARSLVSIRTLHPQLEVVGYLWKSGVIEVNEVPRERGILATPLYLKSPFRLIYEGAPEIRRRVPPLGTEVEFPILADLQELGATDYICLPLRFSRGRINVMSFATDRPGGFSDAELDRLRLLLPVLAVVLEVQATNRVAETLLDTYLGPEAGRRVLSGSIKRGDGTTVAAALWYCDLSGFTALTERLPPYDVIELLDEFFGCMAEPVQSRGGEVLKFIGDAMLAIFPMADDLDRDRACLAALDAARQALADFDALNERRRAAGKETLGVKIALHAGTVIYGNIGAPTRLDFTVIGPAVNMVTRLEGLAGRLGLRLLASAPFAAPCNVELASIGYHPLRGIALQQELFTLPDDAQRRGSAEAGDG